jgi:nucleotidyltransferase substrate binding protein (TIGR01987 family)
MRLELTSFRNAVASLNEALAVASSPVLSGLDEKTQRVIRAGVIQNFEFTYALAVKMIERRLAADAPQPGEIEGMSFPDQIRTACEAGLVKGDWTAWSSYRKARGMTSHAYDEAKAAEVLAIVPGFLAEAQYLLAQLERRNR